MYPSSNEFKTAIKNKVRHINWSGSINTDAPIDFNNDDNILSGEIVHEISGKKLDIGTVYSAQMTMELYLPTVSRYELYGKTIMLSMSLKDISDVIPMGKFTIAEAIQTASNIKIKGYDCMTKFAEKAFIPANHNTIKLPFEWLEDFCTMCGVELGMTFAQVQSLPNGDRKTGFADVVTDVNTYRDALGYLSAYLGCYAYIGRDGKLYLDKYKSTSNDTVPAAFRFTSNLSDFRTTYDGVYATYKEEGLQEYVANENADGMVLDLGINPFLQFTNESSRLDALSEIINSWNGVYYVPYDSEMPLIPTYDVGDVLTFVDNQAGQYDYGCITKIVYKINGDMRVTCAGDNPKLANAQDRFTKSVAGLSSEYNNGQETGGKNFWLLHTENKQAITVSDSTKTLVSQLDWKQTVDVQRMGFMYTAEALLSDTAVVKILITVDDDELYEFDVEEKKIKGKRILTSTCGYRVTGKGTHSAKVYMTVTDNPLKWSELV